LIFHQPCYAIPFPQTRFFNFAGGIARHLIKNNFARAFVARQRSAKCRDLFFSALDARFQFYDSSSYFTKPRVGQANNGRIFNRLMLAEKILNLYSMPTRR
jgi:hypothetical protein